VHAAYAASVLHIHRAERADGLVEALGDLLAEPPPDPFAVEVVAVPTRGMERWLTQRLSSRLGATDGRQDGVCANVAFPSPRTLAGEAVAVGSGIDPASDPWLAERVVWPLLEVIEEALTEPWLSVLAAHLGAGAEGLDASRRARRLSSVRHIAELFDRYARHRPQMLRAWASGDDSKLPADARWQPELWRRLRDRIGVPDPATRLDGACQRLREEPALVDLPPRLSLFGLTRLPAATLQILAALAAQRDVHVFALHPSPVLWGKVVEMMRERRAPPLAAGDAALASGPPSAAGDAALASGPPSGDGDPVSAGVLRRADDPTTYLPTNRLLASWGQDARELQLVLSGAADDHIEHHHAIARPEATLLERIQADVRADRAPSASPAALDPDDRSIQVHACHGRSRQVEVLRGAILHLLAQDPTLEPRDVIVMCPDIETFAPLIQAAFGAGQIADVDDDPLPAEVRPPDLRVRLADRSLRQTNPILGVAGALLDLAGGRVTASQVLDLADRAPVRRRFGLGDDELSRIEDWVSDSGIRWGLDAEHRAPFKLAALDAGTWRAGLDRLLLGVTMTEQLVGGVLALDDVDSGAIDLAGRLVELVDRLAATLDALTTPQPIDAWCDAIATGADALTATTAGDAWQRAELQRVLDDVLAGATIDGVVNTTVLELPEVRALLADHLAGRPTRANFRTGHLTVCTLMPMRSVPHRVVCLLGLDDGAFPRRTARDGDDLILDDPHIGDRDPRAEDRQLLLDALLAATDTLVITYTGNDERTNVLRPPAVPVGELLDVIEATVSSADRRSAREHVLVRHPLQPFDPRDFEPAAHAGGQPWSFDRVTLEGARALTAARPPAAPFLGRPLPVAAAAQASVVELDDLVRFVSHPARAFLRQRLGIGVGDYADELKDVLPVELDALEQWAVGQRLLEAVLDGTSIADAVEVEVARGALPPGLLAQPVLARVRPVVEQIAAEVVALSGAGVEPGSVDVNADLGDGRRLSGTVAGVGGGVVRTVAFSRVRPNARLAAWVRLLALTVAEPGRSLAALTIGRARPGTRDADVTIARIAPLDHGLARDQLAALVDLHDRGMREPLPIACLSSAAYARAVLALKDPVQAARKQWESAFRFEGEDAQPEHELVYGGRLAFDELLAQRPRDDEAGEGWDAGETTRFGRYARRLWSGLLEHEQVSDR
jgi:exodeoxyribonuclease V gamma subunit